MHHRLRIDSVFYDRTVAWDLMFEIYLYLFFLLKPATFSFLSFFTLRPATIIWFISISSFCLLYLKFLTLRGHILFFFFLIFRYFLNSLIFSNSKKRLINQSINKWLFSGTNKEKGTNNHPSLHDNTEAFSCLLSIIILKKISVCIRLI